MRLAVAAIVISLPWAACSMAGAYQSGNFEFDRPFSLRVGQTSQMSAHDLHIGFDGVLADSRCPKGEQCFSAGDATVRVWLQRGSGSRQMLELHTAAGLAQTATALGLEVRLMRLEPLPITGKAIASQAYVAALSVIEASGGSADSGAQR